MAKLVILVAGNISAGKSTLVEYLRSNSSIFAPFFGPGEDLLVKHEPTDPDALSLFYKDREKYTEQFERNFLEARITRYMVGKEHNGIVVFDRGMVEGAETFALNSYDDGYFTHKGHHKYVDRLRDAIDDLSRIPSEQNKWLEQLIVYLEVSDEQILHSRQLSRDTKGETIPLAYFISMNQRYKDFIANNAAVYAKYGLKAPKVLTINASVDMRDEPNYLQSCADKILAEVGGIIKKAD